MAEVRDSGKLRCIFASSGFTFVEMETESDAEGRNALNIPSKILQGLLIVANQNIDVNLKEIAKDLNLAHMERQREINCMSTTWDCHEAHSLITCCVPGNSKF